MAATTDFVVSIIEKGEETGYGVTSEDLESEYAYMIQYYSQQQDFDPVFDGIFLKYELANLKVQRELLNYYALRKGLTIDQLKLEQQVNEVVTNVNNDPEAKPQVEAQYGSMENFYEFVLMVYREDMIRQAAIDNISPMNDAAMKEYYEKNKDELAATYEKVSAKHILVETLEQCESIKADILAGNVTFETAAASFSLDQSNSYKGGDLEWFARGEMVPAFEEACFTAPLNTVTGPVATDYGYHLILVTGRTGFSTFEEFKASENYTTEKDKIQAQAVNTWIPSYMVDNRIEFKFSGTLARISEFAGMYPVAAQSGDYTQVLEFLKNYQPSDSDGMIFLEVCYQSMMARSDQTPGVFTEAAIEEMNKARLSNLNRLSLVEEYTLAALSRYYSLDPNDTHMAVRFLGKYIDQALELTLDEQIMAYYGEAIKSELTQAYPYLEKIAVDTGADVRDRVVGYTYMIRINNIIDQKDLNQELLAKILEIDPGNTDVLYLVQP
jgi:parvulin-like peptidyl-prolyl isomerase